MYSAWTNMDKYGQTLLTHGMMVGKGYFLQI